MILAKAQLNLVLYYGLLLLPFALMDCAITVVVCTVCTAT